MKESVCPHGRGSFYGSRSVNFINALSQCLLTVDATSVKNLPSSLMTVKPRLSTVKEGGLLAPTLLSWTLFHWGCLSDDHQHFLSVMDLILAFNTEVPVLMPLHFLKPHSTTRISC